MSHLFNFTVLVLLSIYTMGCSSSAIENTTGKEKIAAAKKSTSKQATKEEKKTIVHEITADNKTTTCSMREDIRTIVFDKEQNNKGCQVHYTKFEKTYQIAKSLNSVKHCTKIANRVLSNLQAAGFTCYGQISRITPPQSASEKKVEKQ